MTYHPHVHMIVPGGGEISRDELVALTDEDRRVHKPKSGAVAQFEDVENKYDPL